MFLYPLLHYSFRFLSQVCESFQSDYQDMAIWITVITFGLLNLHTIISIHRRWIIVSLTRGRQTFLHGFYYLGMLWMFSTFDQFHRSWGISSNGRAPASHAGGTGIDTRILQFYFLLVPWSTLNTFPLFLVWWRVVEASSKSVSSQTVLLMQDYNHPADRYLSILKVTCTCPGRKNTESKNETIVFVLKVGVKVAGCADPWGQ